MMAKVNVILFFIYFMLFFIEGEEILDEQSPNNNHIGEKEEEKKNLNAPNSNNEKKKDDDLESLNSKTSEVIAALNNQNTKGEDDGLGVMNMAKYAVESDKNKLEFDFKEGKSLTSFMVDIYVKNIPRKDSFSGLADPYLKIFRKSGWDDKGILFHTTPFQWNVDKGKWPVIIAYDNKLNETLIVQVWDSDDQADDLIGSYEIPIKTLADRLGVNH